MNVLTILSTMASVLQLNMFHGAVGRDKQRFGHSVGLFMESCVSSNLTGAL